VSVTGYTWETRDDGVVWVDRGDGMQPIVFSAGENSRRVERWTRLAERAARAHGVPVEWILGVIWAESAGHPDAISRRGAVGLMQVMTKMHGTTRSAMLDPAQNVDKGASILAWLRARRDKWGQPFDLVFTASGYNAGLDADTVQPHPSASSPWGMREQTPYIENVVRAQNHWRANPPRAPSLVAPLLGSLAVVGVAVGVIWFASR
jgi:soluble lytic murein transglycosylase-like protein